MTFTGGEPTLRADLVELVEAAQWFVTRLNTNGRLLTPELCRRLYEASLDSVQVTLYSADAAVHNTLVGAPGFDDTVQGVRNAVAAGLMTSVNTPLCSLNRDYAATLRFVHELGVRYVTCSGLIPSGGAETEASQATRLTQEELTAVLRQAVETGGDVAGELGDVLFAAVKVGRFCGIDPEDAIAGTCEKFIRRFRVMEQEAARQGRALRDMTLEEMTALWNGAKERS